MDQRKAEKEGLEDTGPVRVAENGSKFCESGDGLQNAIHENKTEDGQVVGAASDGDGEPGSHGEL